MKRKDISKEQRRKEKIALERSEQRFRRLVEASSQIVWIANARGEIIEDSPSWRAFTGQTYDQLAGWNWIDIIHPDDRKQLEKTWRKSIKTTKACRIEFRQLNAKGEYRHIVGTAVPIFDKTGSVVEWVGMNQDVTEHKKAEEKLANYAKQLELLNKTLLQAFAKEEALLESIGDGVVAIDKTGKIIALNKQAQSLFEWQKEKMLGKPFFSQFKLRDENGKIIPRKLRPPQLALTTGQVINGICYLNKVNVSQLPLLITSSPVILNNVIIGAITVYRDVSQQVEIDRAKDEFVSIASHELRTPLSTISWSLERLREEDKAYSASQKKSLDQISRQTRNMIQLINDLLVATKMELGVYSYKYEEVNPLDIAKNVIEDLIDVITNKKIKFNSILDKKIHAYKMYSNALHIILENLLSNAVRYTPTGGKISLRISEIENKLVIRVSDSGIGIPKSVQEKIFQKAYRADNVKGKYDGTGLGLYITKAMIDHMKGEISVKSKRNKGATFTVTLPIFEEIIQKDKMDLYNKLMGQISL